MCPAVRIGLSRLFFSSEATKANKNQQLTAGDFGRGNKDQQKSTQFNRSQQKSAKSVSIHERSQQKSAKVSKNHQKSSEIITGLDPSHQKSSIVIKSHHFLLWFVSRVQCCSEQTARIGT